MNVRMQKTTKPATAKSLRDEATILRAAAAIVRGHSDEDDDQEIAGALDVKADVSYACAKAMEEKRVVRALPAWVKTIKKGSRVVANVLGSRQVGTVKRRFGARVFVAFDAAPTIPQELDVGKVVLA